MALPPDQPPDAPPRRGSDVPPDAPLPPWPADERRHTAPEPAEPGWREVFDLAFWTPRGTFGGHVTLVFGPGPGCLYWTSVMEEGRPLVTVVEPDIDPPRSPRSLEIRAQGIWADHNCESPFEHWSYGLEAFAVRLDRPGDALDDGRGERVGLGYDLEWEGLGDSPAVQLGTGRAAEGPAGSAERPAGAAAPISRGYRQAGRVHGEILLGADTYELEGLGVRGHWWGAGAWPEAGRVGGDGVVVGRSMARLPGDGVVERRLLRRADGSTVATIRW